MTEVEMLRKALEPFAEVGEEYRTRDGNASQVVLRIEGEKVEVADFIEAAMVLNGK
jgi:hypothetical protein